MISAPLFDERKLLKQIAEGDERAFDFIYHSYAKKVYLFAFKILRSATLAEEVVQEVMLKIWRMGGELTHIKNLEAYLRGASRNISLNVLRRQDVESRADQYLLKNWEEEHNETEELVLLNDTRKILDDAIALLPFQQREVYKLCHQQGLKYDEVAKKLNLAPSTVATHMKLALRFLRVYLQNHTDLAALVIIFKLF
ncbi:MAG: RNA polymerase sigma-70 factor [Chitinophagaceae bacterium]|nr:MAG: RNA polymerase sigma-70 factor [Chitinophagaceae bacterium]